MFYSYLPEELEELHGLSHAAQLLFLIVIVPYRNRKTGISNAPGLTWHHISMMLQVANRRGRTKQAGDRVDVSRARRLAGELERAGLIRRLSKGAHDSLSFESLIFNQCKHLHYSVQNQADISPTSKNIDKTDSYIAHKSIAGRSAQQKADIMPSSKANISPTSKNIDKTDGYKVHKSIADSKKTGNSREADNHTEVYPTLLPSSPEREEKVKPKGDGTFRMDVNFSPRKEWFEQIQKAFDPSDSMRTQLKAAIFDFKQYWSEQDMALTQTQWETKLWRNEFKPLLTGERTLGKVNAGGGNHRAIIYRVPDNLPDEKLIDFAKQNGLPPPSDNHYPSDYRKMLNAELELKRRALEQSKTMH